MKAPWKVVLALLLGLPALVGAQPCNSTKGQLAYCNALTDAVMFGFPRYTTAMLPTCGTTNKGAVAFDTTSGEFKNCDGSAWAAFGGGGGAPTDATYITQTANGSLSAEQALGSLATGCLGSTTTTGVVAARTITGTASQITVSNGDCSGNPTISIPSSPAFAGTATFGDNTTGGNVTVNATLGAEIAPSLATGANWTSGAGWTAGDPAGIKGSDGTGTLTPASGATVVAGTTYKVVITLSAWSVGSASVKLGGDTLAMSLAAATTYTEFFTPRTSTAAIVITPTNTSRFTISSISYTALTDATGDGEVQGNLSVRSGITSDGPIVTNQDPLNTLPQFTAKGTPTYGMSIGSNRVNFIVAGTTRTFITNSGSTAVGVATGSTGVANSALALTAGTMTASSNTGSILTATQSFQWTNAMVTALGASLTGDITVATLPAKTQVVDVQVVILTAAGGTTTLTVACGRTGAGYIDYIVASDAQAAANTVYGDASAERGTNLTGYDIPSYTGTTPLVCHFVSTGANLSAVTTSTGRVIVTSRLLP